MLCAAATGAGRAVAAAGRGGDHTTQDQALLPRTAALPGALADCRLWALYSGLVGMAVPGLMLAMSNISNKPCTAMPMTRASFARRLCLACYYLSLVTARACFSVLA